MNLVCSGTVRQNLGVELVVDKFCDTMTKSSTPMTTRKLGLNLELSVRRPRGRLKNDWIRLVDRHFFSSQSRLQQLTDPLGIDRIITQGVK